MLAPIIRVRSAASVMISTDRSCPAAVTAAARHGICPLRSSTTTATGSVGAHRARATATRSRCTGEISCGCLRRRLSSLS